MPSTDRLSTFSVACRSDNAYDAASALARVLLYMDKTGDYSGNKQLRDTQQSELQLACAAGHLNTVNYLLSIGTLSIGTGEELLLSSLRFGRNHLDVAKRLVEGGVKATHPDFTFILEDATADGNLDIVKLLVENGGDFINAFTIAMDHKQHSIVKYFIALSCSHGLGLDALPNFIEYNAVHQVNPTWPPLDWDSEWDTNDIDLDEINVVNKNTFEMYKTIA